MFPDGIAEHQLVFTIVKVKIKNIIKNTAPANCISEFFRIPYNKLLASRILIKANTT